MTNAQLVKAFLNGSFEGKNSNKTLAIRLNGEKIELVNYSTVIAAIAGSTVFVSNKFYSPTTSKVLAMVKDEAVVTTAVPHGFLNRHEFSGRDAVGTKVTV